MANFRLSARVFSFVLPEKHETVHTAPDPRRQVRRRYRCHQPLTHMRRLARCGLSRKPCTAFPPWHRSRGSVRRSPSRCDHIASLASRDFPVHVERSRDAQLWPPRGDLRRSAARPSAGFRATCRVAGLRVAVALISLDFLARLG